jgi:hypothetical protein
MRHPSKVGAYCSRKFRNKTDTAPTGTGRMPTKVTGKRGRRHRVPPHVPFWIRLRIRRLRDAKRRAARASRRHA